MKKLIFTILGVLIFSCPVFFGSGLFAQEIPQKISYQGKLLESGVAVNGTKSITFSIGSWNETHSNVQVTDGLYSVTLGETTPIPTNIFDNSSSVSLQIKVEGTTLSPTTEILSVPYAYKAEKAVTAETASNVFSGNYNDLTNLPTSFDDADASPTNELQTLSVSEHTLSISNGNNVTLPDNVDDADADATNELNTNAILNGTNLEITDAGGTKTVDLSSLSSSFTLPLIDQSYSDNTTAIVIENVGANAGICDFEINNASNMYSVLYAETIGTGGVADFRIDNPNNTADVLYSRTIGDGAAGYFRVDNTNNGSYALKVISNGQAEALNVEMTGNDNAGYFEIDNTSSNYYALYVTTNSTTEKAGKFIGNVYVTGTLTKSSSSFKIDHPLDPKNKYLEHSTISSPDMLNVYNGNIVLDNNGEAIVEMPKWFEVLNKEFRYLLTCIGAYAPVYIAEKISNNSFKIAGGTKGMEVSWQVTGVRQDPYANQNRIQVEVEKSEKEKGHYLHYKEYEQSIEKSIEAVKNPEILEELKGNDK
ncbi:MAG: hypothetical protein KAT68_05330 [Bacteroidales bacterium]|nr:hypothetical protein [Bacteroidales bacterium]